MAERENAMRYVQRVTLEITYFPRVEGQPYSDSWGNYWCLPPSEWDWPAVLEKSIPGVYSVELLHSGAGGPFDTEADALADAQEEGE